MASERTELASAELLRRLRSAIQHQAESVPEGWLTANQWSDQWKISANAAGIVLNQSVKLGLMETKKFRIDTKTRGNYPTPHYKPTDEVQIKDQANRRG
jgi:Fic family protein